MIFCFNLLSNIDAHALNFIRRLSAAGQITEGPIDPVHIIIWPKHSYRQRYRGRLLGLSELIQQRFDIMPLVSMNKLKNGNTEHLKQLLV